MAQSNGVLRLFSQNHVRVCAECGKPITTGTRLVYGGEARHARCVDLSSAARKLNRFMLLALNSHRITADEYIYLVRKNWNVASFVNEVPALLSKLIVFGGDNEGLENLANKLAMTLNTERLNYHNLWNRRLASSKKYPYPRGMLKNAA